MKNLINKITKAALTLGLAGTLYSANDANALNARHIETLSKEYFEKRNVVSDSAIVEFGYISFWAAAIGLTARAFLPIPWRND